MAQGTSSSSRPAYTDLQTWISLHSPACFIKQKYAIDQETAYCALHYFCTGVTRNYICLCKQKLPFYKKYSRKKKSKKNPGIILSVQYSIFIGIDSVPDKIWPYKKFSLLLNNSPGQTFCESTSFNKGSGDKFVSLWSKTEGPIKVK